MIARRILLACLLLAMSLLPASAGNGDGFVKIGDLLHSCKEGVGSPQKLICLGYISGIGDTMQVVAVDALLEQTKPLAMCGNARYSAMVQAFVNWAEKHPERWEEPRRLGVITALKELWPCK